MPTDVDPTNEQSRQGASNPAPGPSGQAELLTLGAQRLKSVRLTLLFPELNSRRMIYQVSQIMEIVKPTRFIERSSRWTGRGVVSPPLLSASVISVPPESSMERQGSGSISARRHGPIFRNANRKGYLIDLGLSIDEGAVVEVKSETAYLDEAGTFEPFLSTSTDTSIEQLELTVKMLPAYASIHSVKYVHVHDGGGTSSEESLVSVATEDDLVSFQKILTPPEPGAHRILWAAAPSVATV